MNTCPQDPSHPTLALSPRGGFVLRPRDEALTLAASTVHHLGTPRNTAHPKGPKSSI